MESNEIFNIFSHTYSLHPKLKYASKPHLTGITKAKNGLFRITEILTAIFYPCSKTSILPHYQ